MLRFPRAYYLAALVALTLSLPSLFADFYCDDQFFVLRLDGVVPTPARGPFNLYTFASGAPDQRAKFVDHGFLPWWTVDGLRLSFCRPLSSLLFALDHAVAGHHPLLYHLHSIAWYVLAVLVAARLFKRLLPEREGALATLLFAAAPAHWMLAAWPSSRHVAISGVFALAAIYFHLALPRPSRNWRASIPGLVCALMALAGGETALAVFAYVLAYEAFGRSEALSLRMRALAPWAALLLAYTLVYRARGYGVRGSGPYVDPIANPASYLAALPTRLAVYADAALLGPPAEITNLAAKLVPKLATLGVLGAIAFTLLLVLALSRLDAALRRTVHWLLAGAVLSVLPGAAGIPGDRILFMPTLGITAALAIIFLHAVKRGSSLPFIDFPARAGVVLFAFVHVVIAPLAFAFGAGRLASTSHAALAAASAAEIPARAGLRVYGIGLSDPLVGMYLASSLSLAPRPEPRPSEVHLLSVSPHDHRVRRTGERTIEIAVDSGTFFDSAFESLVRPATALMHAGDIVALGTSTVEILADAAGHPTRFAVTFDRPVDDPSIALVDWQSGALRTIAAMPIGAEVFIPHEVGPTGL